MKIAIVLPSGPIRDGAEREAFEAGVGWLGARGHEVALPPLLPICERTPWLAATDAVRARALAEATRAGADVVWMGRGGSGAARTLAALADEVLAPSTLFGFSDGTTLVAHWQARGWPCWSAPPIVQIARMGDRSQARLEAALGGSAIEPFDQLDPIVVGACEGQLAGGNLAVLASLVGTPMMPRLGGRILVLEEVGEAAYRIDRMLHQLLYAGAFDGVAGVVIGALVGGVHEHVAHAVADFARGLGVPCAAGLPVGHASDNAPLPFGSGWVARLEVGADTARLVVTQEARV